MDHCDEVLAQFFQPFYLDRIERVKNADDQTSQCFDLGVLKFWCSVCDFYGGINYLAKGKAPQRNRDGGLKLAHSGGYRDFFNDYFPDPEKNYGKIFYNIFRSGVVHQMSPKKAGIHWQHQKRLEMIWVEERDSPTDIIAYVNVKVFQQYAYDAFHQFHDLIKTKLETAYCQNIWDSLLSGSDMLGDEKALNDAYNALKVEGYDIKR
jgi:hypothetical protein